MSREKERDKERERVRRREGKGETLLLPPASVLSSGDWEINICLRHFEE